MVSISIYPLPAAHILLLGAIFVGIAYLIKPSGALLRGRSIIPVALLAITFSAMSGGLMHTRHSGTRLQTTYGWPKPMFARWIDPETQAGGSTVIGRGAAENIFFYGCVSVLLTGLYLRSRPRS